MIALLVALLLIPTKSYLFNMGADTPFLVFINDQLLGVSHTWYTSGVLSFEASMGPLDRITVIAASDTTVSSVDDPPLQGVAIYPNPFNGILTVKTPGGGLLEFFDVSGRRVEAVETQPGEYEIVVTLPAGVYFWRLGRYTGKAVSIR